MTDQGRMLSAKASAALRQNARAVWVADISLRRTVLARNCEIA
jgi:hypothetical protein